MKKCGWCSRLNSEGVSVCVCGWRFPSSVHLAILNVSRAVQSLSGEKIPCNDISFWQRRADGPPHDFEKMATKSKGCWFKRSQATRKDRDGDANYAQSRGIIARGGYHYIDFTKPILDQIDFFFATLGDDIGELAPWLDWEEWNGAPYPGAARVMLREAIERANWHLRCRGWDLLRQKLGLYTSNGYWATFGSADLWWAENADLMIAHYGVVNPIIPRPWKKYRVHQWGFGDGLAHGVQSLEIDMDNFNGGIAEWHGYALPLPGLPVPPELPPGDEVMTQMKCIANVQNVRSGHGTGFPVAGQITKNTMVDVVSVWSDPVTLGNIWAKIVAPVRGWAAIRHGGVTYLTGGGE